MGSDKLLPSLTHLLLSDRNAWMAAVFVCYIATSFAFARVYYWLYQSNPRAFSFNADIVRGQSRSEEIRWKRRLADLESDLAELGLLQRELLAARSEPGFDRKRLSGTQSSTIWGSEASFTVNRIEAVATPSHYTPPLVTLKIKPLNGSSARTVDGRESYSCPRTLAEYRTLAELWTNDLVAARNKLKHRLDSLTTDAPEVWSYWDFLYFSGITQFTVGYGDILPNATSVRLVVLSQTIIAAAMLVVVINLAFSS